MDEPDGRSKRKIRREFLVVAPPEGVPLGPPRPVSREFRVSVPPDEVSGARLRFAENLDGLLGVVGFGRKEAAERIGIDYRFVRRLVSAGVSRPDERTYQNLRKIKDFFGLPTMADLWRADLVPWLLTAKEGHPFVSRFREELDDQLRRLRELHPESEVERIRLLEEALGQVTTVKLQRRGWEHELLAALLNSENADTVRTILRDYGKLIPPEQGPRETEPGREAV